MAEHPDAALIRKAYAAFAEGDMATVAEQCDDNVVWTVAGRSAVSGTYTGKTQVFGTFLTGLGERSGGSLVIEIETVVADDAHAGVLSHQTASHEGRTLDARNIDVYTIRDGRVVEVRTTSFNPEAGEAFYI